MWDLGNDVTLVLNLVLGWDDDQTAPSDEQLGALQVVLLSAEKVMAMAGWQLDSGN